MLKVWPPHQFGDYATVYEDTASDSTFYLLPNAPRLRRDPATGKPVFMFVKYRFDPSEIKDGAQRGGGYVQFDCELSLPDDKVAAITAELQNTLNKKYQDAGGNPPTVQIASVPWAEDPKNPSSVELHTLEAKEDGSGMVRHILGSGGKPSMIGSNVACFSMELTQNGAELLWGMMQMATIPVQVVYHVDHLAQIPSMQMHVWLYAHQYHDYWQHTTEQIDHTKVDRGGLFGAIVDFFVGSEEVSTDAKFTDVSSEVTKKRQIMGMDILSWPSGLSGDSADGDKLKQSMIQWGQSILQDTLKDSVKDKFDPTKDAQKGQQGDYLETIRDYSQDFREDLDLRFDQEQIVFWPVNPQASMDGFLKEPGADGKVPDLAAYVREVDLNDPFFSLLQVRVHCNADFQNDPIFSVKVHIEYGQTVKDLLFTDSATVQVFQAFKDDGHGNNLGNNYSYWYEISYKNSDKIFKSAAVQTNETELVIGVKEAGYLKVGIIAGAFNWDIITAAQVHVRYSDSSNSVTEAEETVQLTKDTKTTTYQRVIYAAVTQPYQYKVIYFLKDEQQVARDWQPERTEQLFLNDIFSGQLIVKLLSSGGFDHIASMVVDVSYADAAHKYQAAQTYQLAADQGFFTWVVPLWDGAPQDWRYRTTLVYKDGHSDAGDWQTKTGSQTLIVGETVADYLTVNLMPDLLDFATLRLAKVSVHYLDAANGIDTTEDFVFTKDKKTEQTWKLPIKDKTKKSYTYNITFYMTDGSHRTVPNTQSSEDTIIPDPSQATVPAAATP